MSARVRVLHILPSIEGYGAERQVVELLQRLSSPDVDARLMTIYEPSKDAAARLPFPINHAGRKNRRDYFFLGRLVRGIRETKPDIVHTHTHVGKYWGRFAAILAGVPYIVHTEHIPCNPKHSSLERIADLALHPATARIVTFFREQAESLSRVERLPREKVAIIPNGLTLPESPPAERVAGRKLLGVVRDQFAIVVIGRMEFQKNQILALRALAAMGPELRKTVMMYFIGAGEDEILLRGLSRALQIDENVRFLGFRKDVPELLAGADLVLMTSWFEGMPLTLIEAMIAGVPIVSTPWVGARNMLGDGRFGFITPDYEPARVASEIERALMRPIVRKEIAQRAQQHVYAEYGIGRMVDSHRKLYLQLQGAR